jgi:hypothetical protein
MIAARLALATLCLAAAGCDRDDVICDEKSPGVAYARSLSQERLARLYYDMEKYSTKDETPLDGWWAHHAQPPVPAEFADLDVARIRPRDGNIMVHGCFDHYIYLAFEGVGDSKKFDKERRIVLSWGEHEEDMGEQVLWVEDTRSKRCALPMSCRSSLRAARCR